MNAISSSKIGLALAIGMITSIGAKEKSITEFDSSEGDKLGWGIVNDGVMGGRSSSRVERTDEGIRFSGNLSLANNGGFASTTPFRYTLPLSLLLGRD